jgi:hypothetical protein
VAGGIAADGIVRAGERPGHRVPLAFEPVGDLYRQSIFATTRLR